MSKKVRLDASKSLNSTKSKVDSDTDVRWVDEPSNQNEQNVGDESVSSEHQREDESEMTEQQIAEERQKTMVQVASFLYNLLRHRWFNDSSVKMLLNLQTDEQAQQIIAGLGEHHLIEVQLGGLKHNHAPKYRLTSNPSEFINILEQAKLSALHRLNDIQQQINQLQK